MGIQTRKRVCLFVLLAWILICPLADAATPENNLSRFLSRRLKALGGREKKPVSLDSQDPPQSRDDPTAAEPETVNLPPRTWSFPDVAAAIAESRGIKRPQRAPLPPLPPIENTNSLPKEAVVMIIFKMASLSNWKQVAYGASNHSSVEDKLRASWMRDDEAADLREYLAKLNSEQVNIVERAFEMGTAEAWINQFPDNVNLEWVLKKLPPKNPQ